MNKVAILKDMVMVVDSRERKNEHIIQYFEDNKIPYVVDKLKSGDYSFFVPNNPDLNVDRKFIIEKKNSLTELASNFTADRERFHREFQRLDEDETMHLLIEGATFKKLLAGSYRSSFAPNAYLASLLSFCIRYDIKCWFCTPDESGELIYKILYYELYEYLHFLEREEK